jgi:hypothetical protein
VINTTDGAGHLWTYGTTNATIHVDPLLNGGVGSDPFEVVCTEGGLIERTVVVNAATVTGSLVDCDGRAVAGVVFARWAGGVSNSTAAFGDFSIAVSPGVEVTVYTTRGDRSATIEPLASGASASVGAIKVCSGGSWTNRQPDVGSIYTFRRNALDSNGFKVPGRETIEAYQVIRTGVSIRNRSDVVMLVSNDGDTLYVAYESNGDFTLLDQLDGLDLTFPVASRVPQTIPVKDDIDSPGEFIRTSGLITFEGSEELIVQGTAMNAHRGKLILNQTSFVNNEIEGTARIEPTYWYVPQLGFFARFESTTTVETVGGVSGRAGSRLELESYTLR